MKISFNPHYLMDMCGKVKGSVVSISIVNGLTPVCGTETVRDAQVSHLVLPVRPKDAEEAENEVAAELQSRKAQNTEQGAVTAPHAPKVIPSAGKGMDPYELFE